MFIHVSFIVMHVVVLIDFRFFTLVERFVVVDCLL